MAKKLENLDSKTLSVAAINKFLSEVVTSKPTPKACALAYLSILRLAQDAGVSMSQVEKAIDKLRSREEP